ncbi:MAG: cytochrome c-type biogenesis protein CcmH [Dehalococcoidia bacterium]|nr:cytochrome c-type biogenesis protein CcmH [Dehalococcoidia bacterium]
MIYVKNLKFILLFNFFLLTVLCSCILPEEKSEKDLYIQLEKEIMCPVCDGQTLDQSQSLIAEDMKNTIKEKVSQGYNKEEIKNYFVARYGEGVIAYPKVEGFNIFAYLIPIIGLIFSLLIFGFYIRKQKLG